ncbi:MAG: hypothetical protein K2X32_01050, partial [Phycisphaerales bacterium]|nr:hypothetical protein [Phycisphaerales bacterium]
MTSTSINIPRSASTLSRALDTFRLAMAGVTCAGQIAHLARLVSAREGLGSRRDVRQWLGLVVAAAVTFAAAPSHAQITIPITNQANLGTDGAFSPTQSTTQFLQAAVTGSWEQAGTGVGVYDASKWAVVYKFSSVNIPANVTVSFSNHPTGAPVVWLVNGNVTINGTVNLTGAVSPSATAFAQPGPGGFRG